MKVLRYLRFSKHEQIALAIAFALLVAGVALSRFQGPGWLAGFGALISITGVLLALCDLAPKLDAKAQTFANLQTNLALRSLIESIEDESHTTMTGDDRATAKALIDRHMRPDFEARAQIPKRRYLAVGAFIICLGTFINGFGTFFDSFIRP